MPVVKSASSAKVRITGVRYRSEGKVAQLDTGPAADSGCPVDSAVTIVLAVRQSVAWSRTANGWPVVVNGWRAGQQSLSCLASAVALSCQVRPSLVLQNDVQSVDDTGNVT